MKFAKSIAEVIVIAGLAVFTVMICRQYVFNPYGISGASMSPNFHDGDYVFVDQISYRFRSAKRGEVVVFHSPASMGDDLLKRVIGLPGERVVVANGKVKIFNKESPDGFVLDENYLDPTTATNGSTDVLLKDNQYFVMGDNRSVSFDSRSWGPLDSNLVVGKVALRLWPPEAKMVFGAEHY